MIISSHDGVIRVEISVLIVEDEIEQAISLARLVESYTSIFESLQSISKSSFEVKYRVLINGKPDFKPTDTFEGKYAYLDSLKYLNESIGQIDLILCDHYLRSQNGNELLKRAYELETICSRKCYKVLHSVKPEYQKFQSEKHVNFVWDAKTRVAIHTVTLPRFEERVLKPIFFGHPQIVDLLHAKAIEEEYSLTEKVFRDLTIRDVIFRSLYMHSTKTVGNNHFYYLNDLFNIHTGHFSKQSLSTIAEYGLFIKVSDSLYINKLWYADHDVFSNRVKFITSGNNIFILDINKIAESKRTKKRGHEVSLLKYFSDLVKRKDSAAFPDFTLDAYFHL